MKTTYKSDKDGNVTREGHAEEMREIKSLREVPGQPMHCGKPMRKMQNGGSAGTLLTVYVCDCGKQERA